MKQTLLILVAGSSGSGKSTVVREMMAQLGEDICTLVPLDMFYLNQSSIPVAKRVEINFDHPDAIDWEELYYVVRNLQEGNKTKLPFYDFVTHTRIPGKATPVSPKKIIIVEGIMVLWGKKFREMADYSIFVDAPMDTCLSRRLRRDTAPETEGGRGRTHDSVSEQWEVVRDMYLAHFEPTKMHAHLIIPRGGKNDGGITLLVAAIRQLLSEREE
mgnify:FL=1